MQSRFKPSSQPNRRTWVCYIAQAVSQLGRERKQWLHETSTQTGGRDVAMWWVEMWFGSVVWSGWVLRRGIGNWVSMDDCDTVDHDLRGGFHFSWVRMGVISCDNCSRVGVLGWVRSISKYVSVICISNDPRIDLYSTVQCYVWDNRNTNPLAGSTYILHCGHD